MNRPAAIRSSPAFRQRRGLTLVELMVAMTVLLILIGLTLYILALALKSWTVAERERNAHDRAMGALDIVGTDIKATALPTSSSRTDLIQMYGYQNKTTQNDSFLYFTRTIERGREQAMTYLAADGMPPPVKMDTFNTRQMLPPLPDGVQRAVDTDPLQSTGDAPIASAGYDYKAMGGIMEVAYFVKGRKLYRYFNSPVTQPYSNNRIFDPADSALVVDNVLYFEVLYWTPITSSWTAAPLIGPKSLHAKGGSGPETFWDSTRANSDFTFYAGTPNPRPIFPMRVKVTLVLDWPPNFNAKAILAEDIDSNIGSIRVASSEDLPAGGRDDSYVLIGNEWIRYSRIDGDTMVLDPKDPDGPGQRGARGSGATSHSAGDEVHFGRTFVYFISLPHGDVFVPEDRP